MLQAQAFTSPAVEENSLDIVVQNVGGPLGIRSALAAGATGSSGLQNEIAAMNRDAAHLLVGTPAKVNEVFSVRGGVPGGDVRLLIVSSHHKMLQLNLNLSQLDEVDQLIVTPIRSDGR